MLSITPIYAGLLAVLFFWLSLRISMMRLNGYGSDDSKTETLQNAVRMQRNSAEYIPLGLILILLLELQGSPAGLVHLFGVLLLAGRIGYFAGFGMKQGRLMGQVSVALTYSVLAFGGIATFFLALFG